MTRQDALDYIREHLTKLYANPNMYEDGTCNVIQALEEHAIPRLEKPIHITIPDISSSIILGRTRLEEVEARVSRLTQVSGYGLDELIELFGAGYTLQPPTYTSFEDLAKEAK